MRVDVGCFFAVIRSRCCRWIACSQVMVAVFARFYFEAFGIIASACNRRAQSKSASIFSFVKGVVQRDVEDVFRWETEYQTLTINVQT